MSNVIEITLTGDAGTIKAMEHLRNNGFPGNACFIFFKDELGRDRFTCSKCVEGPPETLVEADGADIQGMKRYGNPQLGWFLLINEQWYFLSRA